MSSKFEVISNSSSAVSVQVVNESVLIPVSAKHLSPSPSSKKHSK